MSLSIAGSLTPIRFMLPSLPAASEPQKSRCSFPGESDWANVLTTTQYTNHHDRFETRLPLHGGITVRSSAGPRFIFSWNSGERISAGLAGRGIR